MTAREEVLARVRRANQEAGRDVFSGDLDAPIPRDYPRQGKYSRGSFELTRMLTRALGDYGAEVAQANGEEELETCLAQMLSGCHSVVVPTGLPIAWVKVVMKSHQVFLDGGGAQLTSGELNGIDAVVTGSCLAIAPTGTIVLNGAPDQGRRALSLVPDTHIVVVHTDTIVETVPEAFAILSAEPTRPLTWIAGPSATSDIELSRVEGVHGPRTLKVILSASEES